MFVSLFQYQDHIEHNGLHKHKDEHENYLKVRYSLFIINLNDIMEIYPTIKPYI